MYITDLKKDFYDIIIGKRCVIFVNFDIDAICACKILQSLFICDNIIYTVVPIRGVNDLKTSYEENNDEVEYFVLINCGGTIDIIEVLEPDETTTFFIVDSHRPIDVCNVYSNKQICVLGEAPTNVPEFDDLFRDDSDEEDEDLSGDEDESGADKRRRLDEQSILKRREKRLWEEKRDKLMFDYSQFSYYGKSSALIVFELAWSMTKDNMDLLWWAIVGVTEQILLNKIENQDYVLGCKTLQEHVSRLTHASNDNNETTALKITFENDLRLALYRHWTVEASIRNTMYTACTLKLWTLRGEKRLHELLAEMGLPLAQSRQNFSAMDLELKKEFHEALERVSGKYGLDNITYGSFALQYGYRNRFCASDVVYAMLGVLETVAKNKSSDVCFLDALDCLSRLKKDLLETGIERAKKILGTIFKQVQCSLDMRQVASAGPFVYLIVQEGTLDCNVFSHPHCLSLLAQFALRAYVAVSRSRKASGLPLVCSAPLDSETGTCLMLGVPPISEDSPKSFFGKAFEKAASTSSSAVELDYFDTSVIQIQSKDRSKFLDALTALLSL